MCVFVWKRVYLYQYMIRYVSLMYVCMHAQRVCVSMYACVYVGMCILHVYVYICACHSVRMICFKHFHTSQHYAYIHTYICTQAHTFRMSLQTTQICLLNNSVSFPGMGGLPLLKACACVLLFSTHILAQTREPVGQTDTDGQAEATLQGQFVTPSASDDCSLRNISQCIV